MVETKRPSVDELIKSMNEYIKELDNMNEKDAKKIATESLIRMGVLDENGNTKEDIVTGDFFGW
ncbi:MAG: hypothetical protein E7510_14370 [Ruminococcus sp.]|mgnify:CR=1 FL=1|nr:hypothetical protein [Ruminococcus sp.]MBP1564973.1 hypothetical protein [Oscillospiraceae bacterium]